MTCMRNYELTPAINLTPGNVILLHPAREPIIVTVVRIITEGKMVRSVSLYREPTDEEYRKHLEDHDEDLRATWVSTCVPEFHYFRECSPQLGNLSH